MKRNQTKNPNMATQRLIQAGAVPSSTVAMMTEWFQDWESPLAKFAREVFPSYMIDISKLRGEPLPLWAQKNPSPEQYALH